MTPDIDVKTICANGTCGVLNVAPSAGKVWLRPIFSVDIPDIPDDMAQDLAGMYHAGEAQVMQDPEGTQRSKSFLPLILLTCATVDYILRKMLVVRASDRRGTPTHKASDHHSAGRPAFILLAQLNVHRTAVQ